MEDAEYPQVKFFNQIESTQLKSCEEDVEVVMDDIGVTLSVPAGAIPESESFSLQVRPVAYGNIEMPADCVSHSPLFIVTPLHFQKEIKIIAAILSLTKMQIICYSLESTLWKRIMARFLIS